MTPRNEVLQGDALTWLRKLATGSVHCVISSPPWFMQRDYGAAGQIGLEGHVEIWTERLRLVMAEIRRVLVDGGSVWLDLADTYSRSPKLGAPTKSLLLAPERLALALVNDGWLLRSKVVWSKKNPKPEAVTDRLSGTYDVVLHLVKQARYHYDLDAIRPELSDDSLPGTSDAPLLGKNPGDVWVLPTGNYRGAHFATFPEQLVERPLLATCPLKVCTVCQTPWQREPAKTFVLGQRRSTVPASEDRHIRSYPTNWRVVRQLGPLVAGCACDAPSRPGLVLDPFHGSGTVGVVAARLGRDWLGIELNASYIELARQRLGRGSPPIERAA